MIIDMNAYIGRWPFAPLHHESAEDILGLMDKAGVDKAAVTSLNSIFYYDPGIGNREVGEASKRHPDRLVPYAVINPNMPRWREELISCVEEYGVKGIKLHPDVHKFSLVPDNSGDAVAQVMAEAAERGLPVHIQTSIVDMRHLPGYCLIDEVPIPRVGEALERYPDNTFIVGGGRWFRARAFELIKYARGAQVDNLYLVTDGLGGPWDGVAPFVKQLGADKILHGSRTPVLYTAASKLMIETSLIDDDVKAQVLGENAARLLGL